MTDQELFDQIQDPGAMMPRDFFVRTVRRHMIAVLSILDKALYPEPRSKIAVAPVSSPSQKGALSGQEPEGCYGKAYNLPF